jgi:hypothetical protein
MPRISKAEFLKLQKKLATDAAIGEKFGITRQAVHQIRKLYGIPSSIADNPERNEKSSPSTKRGRPALQSRRSLTFQVHRHIGLSMMLAS